MSLLRFFDDPWMDVVERPMRLMDQRFGDVLGDSDMFTPYDRSIRPLMSSLYYRPWRTMVSNQDSGSTLSNDKEKFQVSLDVQQFKPEEISVKVTDNVVTVEGKHEERKDEHGFVSRQFIRKYVLPKDCSMEQIKSSLSSDGVLSIQAPKLSAIKDTKERSIPIQHTGPTKAVSSSASNDSKSDKSNSVPAAKK